MVCGGQSADMGGTVPRAGIAVPDAVADFGATIVPAEAEAEGWVVASRNGFSFLSREGVLTLTSAADRLHAKPVD